MNIGLILTVAVVALLLTGVLTAAEAAYLYLPRKEAEELVAKNPRGALAKVFAHPRDHTDALRFWRIFCEFLAAVLLTTVFTQLIPLLPVALVVATVLMAVISFVFVGISPRQLGRRYDRGVVVGSASFVHILRLILGPIPQWLAALGRKISPQAPDDRVFFAEEHFMEFVNRANEAEVIEDAEVELIQSVVELSETRVRAVMVPRTDMITIDSGSSLTEAMDLFLRSGNSRIPVIGEDADDVHGVLYLKDVAEQLFHGAADTMTVDQLQREAQFVPESKAVAELLKSMQAHSHHVAIVVDEYGGTAGLVTLEDLIEEIVGEIVDEYDDDTPAIEALDEAPSPAAATTAETTTEQDTEVDSAAALPRYRVDTSINIDDFCDYFGVELDEELSEDVDTLGGLFAQQLGRVPLVGSQIRLENLDILAERREHRRNRVSHVIVTVHPAHQTAEESEH